MKHAEQMQRPAQMQPDRWRVSDTLSCRSPNDRVRSCAPERGKTPPAPPPEASPPTHGHLLPLHFRRHPMRTSSAHQLLRLFAAATPALSVACQPSREEVRHDSAVASVGSAMDSPDMDLDTVGHSTDSSLAADADQRFLRWMLDHHAELVYLAHQALARPDSTTVHGEARRLDQTHDAETAAMRRLLTQEYGDSYRPTVRREHVAMVAPLAQMSRDAFPTAFRTFLITHHREAVRAIDSLLPELRRTSVRAVAESLRVARGRDIGDLERRGGGR